MVLIRTKNSLSISLPNEEIMEKVLEHRSVNKIEKYRKIMIIYGSFNKFCPVKCSQILLPIYVLLIYFSL